MHCIVTYATGMYSISTYLKLDLKHIFLKFGTYTDSGRSIFT
jgi:hypothetical protein